MQGLFCFVLFFCFREQKDYWGWNKRKNQREDERLNSPKSLGRAWHIPLILLPPSQAVGDAHPQTGLGTQEEPVT